MLRWKERNKNKTLLKAPFSKHFTLVKINFQFFIYSGICDLAEKYGALTFIDECHATGFLGETGRYSVETFLIKDNCLLLLVSLKGAITVDLNKSTVMYLLR